MVHPGVCQLPEHRHEKWSFQGSHLQVIQLQLAVVIAVHLVEETSSWGEMNSLCESS